MLKFALIFWWDYIRNRPCVKFEAYHNERFLVSGDMYQLLYSKCFGELMTLSIAFDMLPPYEIKIENINGKTERVHQRPKRKGRKKNPTEFCVIRILIFSGIDEICLF